MNSVIVTIAVFVAVLHAGFVHTRTVTRISQKAGHISEGKPNQAALISARARQTEENLKSASPESQDTNIVSSNDQNGDQSYVLVPLQDLMRNKRNSDKESEESQDSLYVMFPFQEIIRKARNFEDAAKPNVTKSDENALLNEKNNSNSRERRGVSSQAKILFNSKIAKRRPQLSVRREQMSLSDLGDTEYDDTLHGDPQAKHDRPSYHVSGAHWGKDAKNSVYLSELKSQLHPEMFEGAHQKPRVLTDFSDLSAKVMQNVIGKPKKSSPVNPINITMFISNLIPPNEVENTRITNAGKLYKSGCLKFSIQLERPGPCPCSPDDGSCDESSGKAATCAPVVTQKAAAGHHGGAEDKGKAVEGPSTCSPGSCGQLQAAKSQVGNAEAADPSKSNDPGALNKDVSALLLQLFGAEKKIPKKTAATPGQAVLLDNDVIKEVQRLLANQVASKGSETAGKAVAVTQAPAATGMAPNSPKARAIAEALNLFSKYSALKQSNEAEPK